ncbi:unnamed protein product [Sphagnum balticum]
MLESGKNSGFTLDKNNRTPAKGFSVGVFPEKTGIWDVDKVSEGEIGNWLSQHAQEAFSQGYKIGGWVDNNKFYLDIVKVFPPSQREQAIQAGKEHNQIAIADLAAIHNGDWGNAFIKTGVRKFNPNHDDKGRFSEADAAIESRFAQKLGNYEQAVKDYSALKDTEGGKIINTDTARELSEDYLKDRTKSAAVHEPASAFMKKLYADKLKQEPQAGQLPLVLFTAGGTGAGKTTAIQNVPDIKSEAEKAQIIYDTNLNNYASAKSKIDQALEAGKNVHIAMVQRDPVEALTRGALPRAMGQEQKFGSGRTVPLKDHLNTHIDVVPTVKALAKFYANDPRVKFTYIDNSRGKGNAAEIDERQLKEYNRDEVKPQLEAALEKEHTEGRISDKVYRGFKDG